MHPLSLLNTKPLPKWKEILRQSFTRVHHLADYLELNQEQRNQLILKPKFPIQVPLRLAQKMQKATLEDPIVLQFLPTKRELDFHPLFVSEPVCDGLFQETGKLLQKYQGRVLLVCTSACAMHCRYCFRQNYNYVKKGAFEEELKWIAQDPSIHEVILSGGDPLSLSNESLVHLLEELAKIPHIKRIRFHTRFLIGIPERIDEDLLKAIEKIPQQVFFVIHCNHPKELDQEIFASLKSLQRVGCLIFNQAVLLKGINNDAKTLVQLCLELSNRGILPYYLHQLDRVQGASHFEVAEDEGKMLMQEIAKGLPGYALPRHVREIAGEPHKTLL
jgi:EF-P beta-lysylation protein EpmB